MLWDLFLPAVLAPAAAAPILAALLGRGRAIERPIPAAAVGGAVALSFVLSFGAEDLLSPRSWHWLFWGSVAAASLALVPPRLAAPPALAAAAALVVGALSSPMLGRLVPHALAEADLLPACLGLGVAAGLAALLLEGSARRLPPRSLLPALAAWAGGAAGLFLALGSARLGQIAGSAAAAAGGLALLAWLRPLRPLRPGAGGALAAILVLIGADSRWFGREGQDTALALAAGGAVALAALARLRCLRRLPPAAAALLLAAAAVLPTAAGLAIALRPGEDDVYAPPLPD
ncbi:MAG: hypothetical protein D6702_00040 [Planctomycetota bacterium]|nr:MAG: hypothetical protein D6702_00040 [Planctomycetota bacterium]